MHESKDTFYDNLLLDFYNKEFSFDGGKGDNYFGKYVWVKKDSTELVKEIKIMYHSLEAYHLMF